MKRRHKVEREETGKRIRMLRKEKGWTQKELGKKSYLSNVDISRFETGSQAPEPEELKRIADALGCDTGYLTTELEQPTKVVTDIFAELPLSRQSIELLRELRSEIDYSDRKISASDSRLTAEFVNQLIITSVSEDETEGLNSMLLELLHRLFDAVKVTNEYDLPQIKDGQLTLPYSPMELRRNPPDRYRMARWDRDMCAKAIGDVFAEIALEFAKGITEVEQALQEAKQ